MTEFTPEERAALAERDRRYRERRDAETFSESVEGMARSAFAAGDSVFQCSLVVLEQTARPADFFRAPIVSKETRDSTTTLNGVCREGWTLVGSNFVFVPTSEQSRDKLLRTGQDVAVAGSVLGYYVFRRTERPASRDG